MPTDDGYTRSPRPGTRPEGTSEIDLTARSRVLDGWTVLSIEGEVDLYSAPAVRDAALAAMDSGVDHLVLDLTALPFMDSSGLGGIVWSLNRLRQLVGGLA